MKQALLACWIGISVFSSLGWSAAPASGLPAQITHQAAAQLDDAREIIDEIIRVVGLKANFEIKAARIPNAAAVTYQGKRYVLYNPVFFSELNEAAGNNWAAISVLAHEIGHHLNGHTLGHAASDPANELEADEFSGFVLRRMGASLEAAQSALRVAASYKPSVTHPGKTERLVAIERGWNDADDQVAGRRPARKPTPGSSLERSAPAGPALVGRVRFRSDAAGAYYITNRLHLVKMTNNQWVKVGTVSTLENASFPYMIYDDQKNLLLIDKQGTIYAKNGVPVGTVQPVRG